MARNMDVCSLSPHNPDDEFWEALYRLLRPLAKTWAYNASVPIWKGQEYDIAEEVVQTAIVKIHRYLEEIHENGTSIHSLEHLSIVIAKRSFLDMRRREIRLIHFAHDDTASNEWLSLDLLIDPSQEAEEKIYEEWLLAASAKTIATFSTKLRAAILADLANRCYFDAESTALQQAFLAAGMRLQDYQRSPSPDHTERSRQSALRCLAYKRLSQANIG